MRYALKVADAKAGPADPGMWRTRIRLRLEDLHLARALFTLANCLHEGEDFHDEGLGEVESLYQRALAILERSGDTQRALRENTCRQLAGLLERLGRADEAAGLRNEARYSTR